MEETSQPEVKKYLTLQSKRSTEYLEVLQHKKYFSFWLHFVSYAKKDENVLAIIFAATGTSTYLRSFDADLLDQVNNTTLFPLCDLLPICSKN